MKKILLLMMLCATTVLMYSCGKEESLMDKVLTNVDGSTWFTVEDGDVFELSFDDGQYTLSCVYDGRYYNVSGSYSQNNRKIQFEEKQFVTYTIQKLKTGEISQYGTTLVVPVYDDNLVSKDIAYTLEFILKLE